MLELAIFPGTFNPVHHGHLFIAESCSIQYDIARIDFVLSSFPPNKTERSDIYPVEFRAELLRAAIQGNPKFGLNLCEISRPGLSYTIDTVDSILAQANKNPSRLGMVLGLDAFLGISSWKEAERLKELCHFYVAPRVGWSLEEIDDCLSTFYDELCWSLIDIPPLAVSSSIVRRRLATGSAYRYLVPEVVYDELSQSATGTVK